MPDSDPLPPGLPAGVADMLRSYRPRLASPANGALVARLVAEAGPRDRDDARSLLTAVSGLVLWAEETGLDGDPDVLLEPDVIARYLTIGLDGYAASSVSITGRALGRAARAHGRSVGAYRPRGEVPPEDPYAPDEVDALLSWADAYPAPERRRKLLVLLALAMGCGLTGAEVLLALGTDVSVATDGSVSVLVRGDRAREVVCVRRFERLLARLASEAGKGWAFGPGSVVRNNSVIIELVHGAHRSSDVPTLTAARCRVTWLCLQMEAGVRLDVLAAAAGLDDAHQLLARRAAQLRPPPQGTARSLLRWAARPPGAAPQQEDRPTSRVPASSVPVPPPPGDPETAAVLQRYRSRLVDGRHAPTVRAVARACRPAGVLAAREAAVTAADLVGWADRHGLPTDLPGVLAPEVVDGWLMAVDGPSRWALGTRANRLHHITSAAAVMRPGDQRDAGDGPYTRAAVRELRTWAAGQPDPAARGPLLALLAIGLGAGLTRPEVLRATGEHVTVDPRSGEVVVAVPAAPDATVRDGGPGRTAPGSLPRVVTVLQEHQEALVGIARRAGHGWLLDPSADPSDRAVDRLLSGTPRPSGVPRLTLSRCRLTWMETHLSSGTRADVLLQAAGLGFNGYLTGQVSRLAPPPPAAARASLRGP